MSRILFYPHNRTDKYDKWLPMFSWNNVIIVEDHISNFYNYLGVHEIHNDHEDVVMKLFSICLEEDSKSCYNCLTTNIIRTWNDFHDVLMKIWVIRKDGRMVLTHLHEMKKEN